MPLKTLILVVWCVKLLSICACNTTCDPQIPQYSPVLKNSFPASQQRREILKGTRMSVSQNTKIQNIFLNLKVKKSGKIPADPKKMELALHFIRLFRSLDAIAGGDANTVRSWMQKTLHSADAQLIVFKQLLD